MEISYFVEKHFPRKTFSMENIFQNTSYFSKQTEPYFMSSMLTINSMLTKVSVLIGSNCNY